jgi:hypothetical protein
MPQQVDKQLPEQAQKLQRRFEHASLIGSMLLYRGSKTDIASAYCSHLIGLAPKRKKELGVIEVLSTL